MCTNFISPNDALVVEAAYINDEADFHDRLLKPDYTLGIPIDHYRFKKLMHKRLRDEALDINDIVAAAKHEERIEHYRKRLYAANSSREWRALDVSDEHFAKVFPDQDVPPIEVAAWTLSELKRAPESKHELKGRAWLNVACDKMHRHLGITSRRGDDIESSDEEERERLARYNRLITVMRRQAAKTRFEGSCNDNDGACS